MNNYFLKGLGTYIIATVMMVGGIVMGLLLDDVYLRTQGAALFLIGAAFWRTRTGIAFSDAQVEQFYRWVLQALEDRFVKKENP